MPPNINDGISGGGGNHVLDSGRGTGTLNGNHGNDKLGGGPDVVQPNGSPIGALPIGG